MNNVVRISSKILITFVVAAAIIVGVALFLVKDSDNNAVAPKPTTTTTPDRAKRDATGDTQPSSNGVAPGGNNTLLNQ